jgi:hypothetical protein
MWRAEHDCAATRDDRDGPAIRCGRRGAMQRLPRGAPGRHHLYHHPRSPCGRQSPIQAPVRAVRRRRAGCSLPRLPGRARWRPPRRVRVGALPLLRSTGERLRVSPVERRMRRSPAAAPTWGCGSGRTRCSRDGRPVSRLTGRPSRPRRAERVARNYSDPRRGVRSVPGGMAGRRRVRVRVRRRVTPL